MKLEYSCTQNASGCLLDATLSVVTLLHRELVIVWSGPGGAAFGAARLTELETTPLAVCGSTLTSVVVTL
jgi:hypothetical protein